MPLNNRDATSLWEIVRAIELIQAFTVNMSYSSYLALCDYLEACLGRKLDVLTRAGIANIRNRAVAESITRSLVYVEAWRHQWSQGTNSRSHSFQGD